MVSGIRKMISLLQIQQIFWMLAEQFLISKLFFKKVLRPTSIPMSHAHHYFSQIFQIQWEIESIKKEMTLLKIS